MAKIKMENTSKSYKCSKCGAMFEITDNNKCPVCGIDCSQENCKIVDASDEGY